jgi:hypothetical protein
MAGAALAAVTMMFVPVSLLEGVARSSGLSELLPAAGAPLGDTARACIAFATGAMTLAVLSYLLLRVEDILVRRTANDVGMYNAAAQQEAEQQSEATPKSADPQPTVAEMVAQLEAAVAFRRQKLAELEAVAADLSADVKDFDEPNPVISEPVAPAVIEHDAAGAESRPMGRPVLEAVPSEAVQADDIDSALAAALAALHRINAGAR